MKLSLADFSGVAFDFDGTLADSSPAHHLARERALDDHGITLSKELLQTGHRHGNNPTTIIAGMLIESGHIPTGTDPYNHPLVQQVVAAKNRHYVELTHEGLELLPGAHELFQAVVKFYGADHVAIVTTSPLSDIMPTLQRNNLAGYFTPERLITADTAQAQGLELKPAGDQYRYAAQILDIAADRMLVIEDTTGGIVAGHAAGAPVLAVGTTSTREVFYTADHAYDPDYFADSFTDIIVEGQAK